MAVKAVAGRRFSVLTFAVAQVAMDIEPLVGMVSGASVLHGVTHNYLAALFIAAAVAIIAPAVCRPILRRWNRELAFYGLGWLTAPESWSTGPVIAGALIGTISHVGLDSIMHSDVMPLAPWANTNILLGIVSVSTLQLWCVAAGIVGVVIWLALGLRRRGAGLTGRGDR